MKICLLGILLCVHGSANGFDRWVTCSKGLYPYTADASLFFLDSLNGWVGGGVLKTTDGGNSWFSSDSSSVSSSTGQAIFLNDSIGWMATKKLIHSTDGGLSWDTLSDATFSPNYFSQYNIFGLTNVQFLNSETGWVVGNYEAIAKTTNGGGSWVFQHFDSAGAGQQYPLTSLHFVDALHGWAVGSLFTGVLFRTTNGGEVWEGSDQEQGLPKVVDFVDSVHGWIGDYSGSPAIHLSTDGGISWQPIDLTGDSSNLHYFVKDLYFLDTLNGWAVGNSKQYDNSGMIISNRDVIMNTSDGGHSWSKYFVTANSDLHSIRFLDANRGFVLGDSGLILRYTNNTLVGDNADPKDSVKLDLHPNPFYSTATIDYSLTSSGKVSIRLYNIIGELAGVLYDSFEYSGQHSRMIHRAQFPNGIYFVQLVSRGYRIQKYVCIMN